MSRRSHCTPGEPALRHLLLAIGCVIGSSILSACHGDSGASATTTATGQDTQPIVDAPDTATNPPLPPAPSLPITPPNSQTDPEIGDTPPTTPSTTPPQLGSATPDGAINATSDVIAPAVTFAGERYGESFAMNAAGTLLAISRPVEGRIELQERRDSGFVIASSLPRLEGPTSSTRVLGVALSPAGDMVAWLSGDSVPGSVTQLTVLERIGEGWLTSTVTETLADAEILLGPEHAQPVLRFSDNGDRLLVACTGMPQCYAIVLERSIDSWQEQASFSSTSSDEREASSVRAVTFSASGDRVLLVHSAPQGPARLEVHTIHAALTSVESSALLELDTLRPGAPLAMTLNAAGTDLVLAAVDNAGVESALASNDHLVLWRYRLPTDDGSVMLEAIERLRLQPSLAQVTALSLSADSALNTVALSAQTQAESHLFTVRQASTGWQQAAEWTLDSELQGRPFGQAISLSADGRTLAYNVAAGVRGVTPGIAAGHVRVLDAGDVDAKR